MKCSAFSHLFAALATAALAAGATIDNTDEAAELMGMATSMSGSYTLTSVGTGKSITENTANALGLSTSASTPVTFTAYGSSVAWVRMAFGTKNKCMSAQWGDTGDDNAVMYACQVGAGGTTTSGSTLEPTKQWWILVPTDGDSDSSWGSSQLTRLKTAQAQSVSVRNAANSKFKRALAELDDEIEGKEEEMSIEDRVMRKWSLKKRATNKAKAAASKSKSLSRSRSLSKSRSLSRSKSVSRSKSRSRSLARSRSLSKSKSLSRARSLSLKAKSKSLSKSKSKSRSLFKSRSLSRSRSLSKSKSVSKSRSKSKSKSLSKSKSKSRSRSRSLFRSRSLSKSKAAAKKSTKTTTAKKSTTTKSKTTTTLASGGAGTYWIIPTDHLIDMTTRALSASTVSSVNGLKLADWDSSDENQQWVITAA